MYQIDKYWTPLSEWWTSPSRGLQGAQASIEIGKSDIEAFAQAFASGVGPATLDEEHEWFLLRCHKTSEESERIARRKWRIISEWQIRLVNEKFHFEVNLRTWDDVPVPHPIGIKRRVLPPGLFDRVRREEMWGVHWFSEEEENFGHHGSGQ